MLITCATTLKVTEITRMTPSATQKRPRMSRHERAIAWRMVARSRMIAAGASSSFVESHHTSGIAASTTSTVSPIAAGGDAMPMPTMPSASTPNADEHGEHEQERVADQAPRDGLDALPEPAERQLLGDGGVRDLADDDALDDDAQRAGGEAQHDAGDRGDRDRAGHDRVELVGARAAACRAARRTRTRRPRRPAITTR